MTIGRGLTIVCALALVAYSAFRLYPRDHHTVLLYGDSITDISADVLHRDLDPDFAVTISGVSGARVDQRLPDAPKFAALQTSQVVINLGTNNLFQQWSLDATEKDLVQLAESFPNADCIHLVTMNIDFVNFNQPDLTQRAQQLNAWILATASDRGWYVIRWDLEVRQYDLSTQPEGPITSDSVHPTLAGQHRLAGLYRDALARC